MYVKNYCKRGLGNVAWMLFLAKNVKMMMFNPKKREIITKLNEELYAIMYGKMVLKKKLIIL